MTDIENSDIEEIRAIRVRYSTIINYASVIYRVFTSLAFSIIVLRKLSIDEYGFFMVIMAIIALFSPIPSLWTMWVYRFFARKRLDIASTGFTLTLIYGILASVLVYYSVCHMINMVSNLLVISLLASLTIFGQILYYHLSLLLIATRPYSVGYIAILGETIRLAMAYLTVAIYGLGIIGVLIALTIRGVIQVLMSFALLILYDIGIPRPAIYKENISLFFKNLYIPLLNIIYQQIRNSSERLITVITSGSLVLPAYLGVSYIPRNMIVGGAQAFTRGLSPRLLRGGSRTDIEDVLRLSFIIVFFVMGSLIVYSKTVLSIFRKEYIDAWILFSLYCVVFAMDTFRILFNSIAIALEKADLYWSGLKLKHTVLFKNPFILTISAIIYVSFATGMFMYEYNVGIRDPVLLLLPYPTVSIIIYIPIIWIYYKRSLEKIEYSIPWREFFASLLGTFAIYLYATFTGSNNFIVSSVLKDLHIILSIAFSSALIYFSVLYTCSSWFRKLLFKSIKTIIK